MSKKYNRYFLIFNEEDKGFEVSSDKQPTGYTKMETKHGKCKITFYAQNLKADKGPYYCYLVDSSKNPAVVAKLGEMPLDEGGKGETMWEEEEKNIFKTGLSADKFNVAAIVKEGNRLQVPLAGYSGKDRTNWRDKVTEDSFKGIKLKEDEETIKESVEESTRENVKEDITTSKSNIKDEISQIVEKARNEVLEENKEIVEETIALVEEAPNDSEGHCEKDNSVNEIREYNMDDDYVEEYSEEGMKFMHYEQDINFQADDVTYADNITRHSIEFPEINKMHALENENDSLENENDLFREEDDDEEWLDDARDLVTQGIESGEGILSRAMARMNINREDISDSANIDFDKLDEEIEVEFRKFLDKELRKYKQAVLKKICENDDCNHNHYRDHQDCHSHHNDHKDHNQNENHHNNHKDNHQHKGKGKDYAKILHNILEDFEEVKCKAVKDCRFWKVDSESKFPDKNNKLYPYYSAVHHLKMTYPYINYIKYFRCKGYYHFGIKYDKNGDVKYLIYGIEGDKKESHQPYKGMTGFVSWVPHENTGMWLMYYNPFTGCVMLPKVKEKKKR